MTIRVEDLARRVLRECPLDQPCFQIGRSPDNDLWLNHARVDLHHAVLFWISGAVYFSALSPTAELFGPEGQVTSGWWRPGQSLRIGPFRIGVKGLRIKPPDFDPRAVAAQLESELPRPELRFLGSAPANRPWPITRPLTLIGSSPLCKVRLDDERILPVQAALIRTRGRLWLADLSGEERTRVNGEPISLTALDVGDVLRLGEFIVEVQSASEWPSVRIAAQSQPTANPDSTDLETLMQQLAAQHQQLMDAQRLALENLERLGDRPAAAQIKEMLNQIRESYDVLSRDNALSPHQLKRQ